MVIGGFVVGVVVIVIVEKVFCLDGDLLVG